MCFHGHNVVIEEFLDGIELSCFVLTNKKYSTLDITNLVHVRHLEKKRVVIFGGGTRSIETSKA